MKVIVGGVAGAGKSEVGVRLADRLGARFIDGDSLHPESNVAKMTAGEPLGDADRWPWLDAIVELASTEEHIVVACSALALRYRDRLRAVPGVRFVFLEVDQELAAARVAARSGHFMGAAMVASQFETLERPQPEENDVTVIDASTALDDVVALVLAELS